MSALNFNLEWLKADPSGSGADATWGLLSASIEGQLVWGRLVDGAPQPVKWTWIDLLEGLASKWPWLQIEEGWPLDLQPQTPAHFELERESALEACPEESRKTVETALFEFRERHDLSRGLHGISLPDLWILREGRSAWVASRGKAARLPFAEVLQALQGLGQRIADRISSLSDERAKEAAALWAERNRAPAAELVSIGTGLTPEKLKAVAANEPLAAVFELKTSVLEPTELLAAARMSAAVVEPETIRLLLRAMRSIPPRPTRELDQLARQALAEGAPWRAERAYTQGHKLAEWLRLKLGVDPETAFDPERQLKRWKVQVRRVDLVETCIDAFACWGRLHGPAIVINRSGVHSKWLPGLRATLAHEIAHLLVDRSDALPVSEVLGGKAPLAVERRARAFAAELLLPRAIAGEAFVNSAHPKRTLKQLCKRYAVSREIAAWQANNSGRTLDSETRKVLRPFVSTPLRFRVDD